MTAKEYLEQIEKLQTKIKIKREHAAELRDLIPSVGTVRYDKERVNSSHSNDTMSENIVKLILLEEKIEQMMVELEEEKDKMIDLIHKLDKPEHIKLLYLRYVKLDRLEGIAYKMNLSYDTVRHMHGYALQEFGRINSDLINKT